MKVLSKGLPRRLGHSGHVALVRGVAQADAAKAELAVVGARAPAAPAAVVLARRVLGLAALLDHLRGLRHALSARPFGIVAVVVACLVGGRSAAFFAFLALLVLADGLL